MEKISFFGILSQALRLSFSRPSLLFFGFFMALPFALMSESPIVTRLFNQPEAATLHSLAEENSTSFLLFALIFFFIYIFGKSNLIISIEALSQKKFASKQHSPVSFFQNFFTAIPLALSMIIFFVLVIFILALPAIIFWNNTATLSPVLISLGAITFLPIAIIGFFVQEFSLFYLLLSKISLRSSLENGATLFSKYTVPCLVFGFLFLLITLVFTFCFNLVMLGIVALFQKAGILTSEKSFLFLSGLVYISWLYVLKQTFWLLFFKDIAIPPKEDIENNKKVLIEDSVNELPPA